MIVAGWNAFINWYVLYICWWSTSYTMVLFYQIEQMLYQCLQGSGTYQHLLILCTAETMSVCHTNGIVHVWSWAVQSEILNFMPLCLSVGQTFLRRLGFLPHSGFELVLFLCDVWTFQGWSCWTLPRAESATRDETLELFSSAKYLHYSLFHVTWFFPLLSSASNTICKSCQ